MLNFCSRAWQKAAQDFRILSAIRTTQCCRNQDKIVPKVDIKIWCARNGTFIRSGLAEMPGDKTALAQTRMAA